MGRLIISAGPMRSGSTWLFNAARLLLSSHEDNLYSEWVQDLDPARMAAASTVLIKLHGPEDSLATQADVILTCHRDLRDVAVSLVDVGWTDFEHVPTVVESIQDAHIFWSARSTLNLAYSDMVSRPAESVTEVAYALSLLVESETAVRIAGQLDRLEADCLSERGHDFVSLLHKNHRRDGRAGRWRESQLPQDTAAEIVTRCSEWMLRYGYVTTSDSKIVSAE
jgi:hypothetical protein